MGKGLCIVGFDLWVKHLFTAASLVLLLAPDYTYGGKKEKKKSTD